MNVWSLHSYFEVNEEQSVVIDRKGRAYKVYVLNTETLEDSRVQVVDSAEDARAMALTYINEVKAGVTV